MPSDPILDSLCAEGIARKTIRPVKSSTPEYPNKSLGARHDTVFYNPATQYTMDFWIQADTVVLVKNNSGDFLKASKDALIRFSDWYQNLEIKKAGIFFTISGGVGTGGGSSDYRSGMHVETMDITSLAALFGALSLNRSAGLDIANGLYNLFDGVNNLNNREKHPYIQGQGPLKPEDYQTGIEADMRNYGILKIPEEYKRNIPANSKHSTGNNSSSSIIQTQHVRVEVTVESAQDTIRLANNDSINTINFAESLHKIRARDTIIEESKWGKRWQLEMLRRQDTVYYIKIHFTPEGIIYKDHITGETISKGRYEEIKRSE